jgi:hypothetical protein
MHGRATALVGTNLRQWVGHVTRLWTTLVGVIGLVAVLVSSALIWLCLTQPLTMADAMGDGQIRDLVRIVTSLAISVFERVVRYL